jgi:spore coat protein A
MQASALAGAGVALSGQRVFGDKSLRYKNLAKFVDQLPQVGATGIRVATPNTVLYDQAGAQADYYRIVMGQFRHQFHRDLPSSRVWGYADATSGLPQFGYLGGAIVAKRGTPVRITFINLLPPVHPLPVDNTIPGAETGQLMNRAAVHLHGGFVPWPSDGGPFHWFEPNGTRGPSVIKWLPDRVGRLTDDYWYTNAQSARLLWYHDHAVGITRLNAYAGLAAPYVLIDADEVAMFGENGTLLRDSLPGIPLVLQDKSFKVVADQFGNVGDLDYPFDYGAQEPHPEGPNVPHPNALPPVSAVPEFFAENIVINGKAYPELKLKAGPYRFRILNGTNSRVFNLQLYKERKASGEVDGSFDAMGVFHPNTDAKGPDFVVIGTEGGFLPQSVVIPSNRPMVVPDYYTHKPHWDAGGWDGSSGYGLVLAGAERADVIIDFSGCLGERFILYNDAGSPFPDGGDTFLDYYTNNPDGTGGPERHGPNTRTMMRIVIAGESRQSMPSIESIDAALAAHHAGLPASEQLPVPDAVVSGVGTTGGDRALRRALAILQPVYRTKTLSEGIDPYGRLIAMLGTDNATGTNWTTYGTTYLDAIDLARENYQYDTYEVWDIYNNTGDTHPIHFHLVNVQILGRAPFAQLFDADGNVVESPLGGVFTPSGPFVPPDPNERGFKETVRMDPGQITRVIMRIARPPAAKVHVIGETNPRTVVAPPSPRTGGDEYVWHCHILEHEEHDMMRPFVVK